MNMLEVMRWLWLIGWMKAKLLKMWVPESDMEWVDFTNLQSLNAFAEKVVPKLLKNNPRAKEQIKWCERLEWQTKKDVSEVIDAI